MTNAAKWKEFLRWWEDYTEALPLVDQYVYAKGGIITAIDRKIKELQKDNNAKQ